MLCLNFVESLNSSNEIGILIFIIVFVYTIHLFVGNYLTVLKKNDVFCDIFQTFMKNGSGNTFSFIRTKKRTKERTKERTVKPMNK